MSENSALMDILPPDRSDAAPITTHLRGLLEQLHNGQGERPRITITLDTDAWAMLEAQFRRPYKPHSSYLYLPLDVGTVAFERKREATVAELAGLTPKGFAPPLGEPYRHPLPEPDPPPADSADSHGPPPEAIGGPRPPYNHTREDGPFAPCPICAEMLTRAGVRPPADPPKWDASAIEAKAAALSVPESTGARAADAIYTAPMTGAEATYGGPRKGDGK